MTSFCSMFVLWNECVVTLLLLRKKVSVPMLFYFHFKVFVMERVNLHVHWPRCRLLTSFKHKASVERLGGCLFFK